MTKKECSAFIKGYCEGYDKGQSHEQERKVMAKQEELDKAFNDGFEEGKSGRE